MKVMVMVKATESSEAGKLPSQELMRDMMAFNEELVTAGLMLAGDGLKPTSEGYRVRFDGQSRTVTRGPFSETNELLAGYWIWEVNNMEEALEWVKRCPNPMEEVSDIEIRSFYEMADFADADPTGAVQQQEESLKKKIAMQQATITTYLFFNGDCQNAVNYYREHLQAELHSLMFLSDHPATDDAPELPENANELVMHAEFSIGQQTFFASDWCTQGSAAQTENSHMLALTLQEQSDVERIFSALSEGGKVIMPLSETFWSPLFGQVVDRFGIGWMLMLPTPQTKECQA